MHLAHKIQLNPTKAQIAYFRKACGTSRFVYNYALARWIELYKAGLKPNAMLLKKEFNSMYKTELSWVSEVHRDCHSQPFTNAQKAFRNFFRGTSKYPKFKKKSKTKDSFYISNDKFKVEGIDRKSVV